MVHLGSAGSCGEGLVASLAASTAHQNLLQTLAFSTCGLMPVITGQWTGC